MIHQFTTLIAIVFASAAVGRSAEQQKECAGGDEITFGKWAVPVFFSSPETPKHMKKQKLKESRHSNQPPKESP